MTIEERNAPMRRIIASVAAGLALAIAVSAPAQASVYKPTRPGGGFMWISK